jgi:hypothetical protein
MQKLTSQISETHGEKRRIESSPNTDKLLFSFFNYSVMRNVYFLLTPSVGRVNVTMGKTKGG